MIENTIRTIKEAQADKELTRLARQELTEFKDTLDDRQANSEEELKIQRKMERIRQSQERREQRKRDKFKERNHEQVQASTPSDQPFNILVTSSKKTFKVGDTVRLNGQTQVGEVISVNKNDITVAFGQITSIVKANRLEPAEPVKVQDVRTATYVSKQTHDDI